MSELNSPYFSRAVRIILFALLFGTTCLIFAEHLLSIRNDLQAQYYSEFSRVFDASLIAGGKVYGQILKWPWLDPGRAILDAFIFVLPDPTIATFRAWSAVLWLALPLLMAVSLARRLVGIGRLAFWSVVMYIFLYLHQGPTNYHLLLAPILIFWGYHIEKREQTLVVVALASIWVGICRINWFPVPGLLCAFLYLIDQPRNNQPLLGYLHKPLIWIGMGVLLSITSYLVYSQITGNPMLALDPAFNYSFWPQRLLPNDQFALGVFPALVLVSLPWGIFLVIWTINNRQHLDQFRLLSILSILGLFLMGGLLVSIRIGGTFNLHNMDVFLLFLLVFGLMALFVQVALESHQKPLGAINSLAGTLLVVVIILTPALYNLAFQFELPDSGKVQEPLDYESLQGAIDLYAPGDSKVLFIDYRHLLAFHEVKAPLYIPYEKVTLMEMAMANNMEYLDGFREKIKRGEFAVIISSGHNYKYSTATDTIIYAEENYWAEYVSSPIFKHYQPVYQMGKLRLWIPKEP